MCTMCTKWSGYASSNIIQRKVKKADDAYRSRDIAYDAALHHERGCHGDDIKMIIMIAGGSSCFRVLPFLLLHLFYYLKSEYIMPVCISFPYASLDSN